MTEWSQAPFQLPELDQEGKVIEITQGGEEIITGTLILAGKMTAEDAEMEEEEFEGVEPCPLWIVVNADGEIDFNDVLYWRIVEASGMIH